MLGFAALSARPLCALPVVDDSFAHVEVTMLIVSEARIDRAAPALVSGRFARPVIAVEINLAALG
jgi:hypothetical protein